MNSNPALIQPGGPDCRATPIILFHDGGGTTMFYYHLGNLYRPVYGIADPHSFYRAGMEEPVPNGPYLHKSDLYVAVGSGNSVL